MVESELEKVSIEEQKREIELLSDGGNQNGSLKVRVLA